MASGKPRRGGAPPCPPPVFVHWGNAEYRLAVRLRRRSRCKRICADGRRYRQRSPATRDERQGGIRRRRCSFWFSQACSRGGGGGCSRRGDPSWSAERGSFQARYFGRASASWSARLRSSDVEVAQRRRRKRASKQPLGIELQILTFPSGLPGSSGGMQTSARWPSTCPLAGSSLFAGPQVSVRRRWPSP